jgi:hypothetical protein
MPKLVGNQLRERRNERVRPGRIPDCMTLGGVHDGHGGSQGLGRRGVPERFGALQYCRIFGIINLARCPNQRRTHSSQKPDIYDLMVTDIFIVSPGRKIKFCDSSVFRNYKNSIEAELFEVDRIVVASPGKLTQMK